MVDHIIKDWTTDDLVATVRFLQRLANEGRGQRATVIIAEHVAAELDARGADPGDRADAWLLVTDLYDLVPPSE